MTSHLSLLQHQAQTNDQKIVLLVLDGVGDIHTAAQPKTALEAAKTPNLDALARRSALGRILPVDHGITPGSGPGHLALFGYDPREERFQIGRGVLEALGIGYDLKGDEIAARGNFCTVDAKGLITDRRAGRISTDECRRLCSLLDDAIMQIGDVKVKVFPVEEHRFCVVFQATGLEPDLEDTDPQRVGAAPLQARLKKAKTMGLLKTQETVNNFIDKAFLVLADEPKANALTLRGFSAHPRMPNFQELYKLKPAGVAHYPLYRGVARLAGMTVYEAGHTPAEAFDVVARQWSNYDYFFIHIKKTDSSGEDGNLEAKIKVIQDVDAALPGLLALKPDVLALTGDHCTPCPMKGHSFHPVPLLLSGAICDVDAGERWTETECLRGSVGTIPSANLMGLLLANTGKLAKFGA